MWVWIFSAMIVRKKAKTKAESKSRREKIFDLQANEGIPNNRVGSDRFAVKYIRKYKIMMPRPISTPIGKRQHRKRHVRFKSVLLSLAQQGLGSMPIKRKAK